ncbi:ATP-binding protein [Sulfitobacter sp. R18_1]|uniref:sensor histidine kinase n=1 Tax=Sulfitobacter sp. R18_1 TaxID=2821104 RepID=UPI001ADB0D95|nr:ATP-binding protein [Sulfitobacter sp. R18_1]MBO9430734.1 HAMP domain-containing protein [Sulfitobacter sp. R18_1]
MKTMHPPWRLLQLFGSRISTRLRAAFLLVACIIGLAGWVATGQMRAVLASHAHLSQSALPMLGVSQQIERSLNGVFLSIEQLNQQDTTASRSVLGQEIGTKISEISKLLADLSTSEIAPPLAARLEQRLQMARRATDATVVSLQEMRRAEAQIVSTLDLVEQIQEQSHLIIDDLAYRLSRQTEAVLDEPFGNSGSGQLENPTSRFPELLLSAVNLNDIRLSLDTLINIVMSQGLQNQPLQLARAKLLVEEHFQDAITRLPRIHEAASRRSLARQIDALRDLLLRPKTGLFAHTTARLRFHSSFERLQAEHLPMIVEISDISSDLTKNTLERVDAATQALRDTISQVIWTVGLTMACAFLVIAMTNGLVIERQFNRRIRRLTDSVTAIARGDLDHPITVRGRDELGEMARALTVFRTTAEELRRSNTELEKFAYVAAHDLRSPLRAVHELSLWVLEDEDNALSAESRSYLLMSQQRIDRLNRLLADLLDYARAGQDQPASEPVHLGRLVTELARYIDTEGRFKITFTGADQVVDAQLTPLQQILGNLISNAIKHHDRDHGAIHISAQRRQDHLVLTVRDDGPGIELRHQQKIFELFQTLKPRDEVEGSGLGLAIVSKLAAHQKGKVTLFSDPDKGRGATFVVELPLAPQTHQPLPVAAAA